MKQFNAVAKKWGNSTGVTKKPKTVYGSLHLKKKTQQVMDEIDEDDSFVTHMH